MSFLQALKNFDAYPKTLEDFREKTTSGAVSKKKIQSKKMEHVSRVLLFNVSGLVLMFTNRLKHSINCIWDYHSVVVRF